MTTKQLIQQIKKKKSFLCIGLDVDLDKIPKHLLDDEDPIFAFNKAIMAMSQKSANPTGNQYIFICNERCYADVQVVLAQHLLQFKYITDAKVYSQTDGGKISVGAEYQGYNFLGNEVIFKVDRALSIEYPDRGYAVLVDLTADKTSGQPAILTNIWVAA